MNHELNARVAEELMGWTRPVNKLPDGLWVMSFDAPITATHESGVIVGHNEWRADKCWQAPDGSYHSHLPDYSGDWGLAGEVLILLRKTKAVSVNVHDGPGDLWQVEIDGHGSFALFPEAACRAALKAKESGSDNA